MPVAFLVLRIASQHLFFQETGSDTVGKGHRATAIITHIEDQPLAFLEMHEHIIQVILADTTRETTVIDIADLIVRQTFIFHAAGNLVVSTEIVVLYFLVVVGRIIFVPSPVAGHIKRRNQVGMSVFHFRQHLAEDIKQLILVHRILDKQAVTIVHLVPIHFLILKKAVVFVHNPPERFEVVAGRRVVFRRFLTS